MRQTLKFCTVEADWAIEAKVFFWLLPLKEALYRIWCGVNRLGDSGVNRIGDTSAFVNPAGSNC